MKLIQRYIVGAIVPYFGLALLILTAMLLTQQAARIGEVLSVSGAPLSFSLEILAGLLPNVLVFTVPMALLIGVSTGLTKLGSDSELTAMRAGGVGIWAVAAPALALGTLATVATLYLGLFLAPRAIGFVREATIRASLFKLQSPVEPRVFNTALPGKVVYVKDGDRVRGHWGRVFIHAQESDRTTRIVTAREGRIDTSVQQSELLLTDVAVTTLSPNVATATGTDAKVIIERSKQLRVRLDTGREALIQRLEQRQPALEELGWYELYALVTESTDEKARSEAQLSLHKKLSVGFGPLAFTILGLGFGIRARRGGRGVGVLLSLGAMLAYYLLTLGGEALGRAGAMPTLWGAWLATACSALYGASLIILGERKLFSLRATSGRFGGGDDSRSELGERGETTFPASRVRRGSLLLGLLDKTTLRTLCLYFLLSFVTLLGVFLIFTLFELWRFIVANGTGASLVARYLVFLTPLGASGLLPVSVLVSVLITYALLSKRSEAIAWWASGQSAYRLALPGLFFAVSASFLLWTIQEKVLPAANRRQETLRALIRRSEIRGVTSSGRQWLAPLGTTNVYSYQAADGPVLKEPSIFVFDSEGIHLTKLIEGETATWTENGELKVSHSRVADVTMSGVARVETNETIALRGGGTPEAFKPLLNKLSELNQAQLSDYLKTLRKQHGASITPYLIALERKKSDLLAPIVMAMIGIPLALAFGRRSAIMALVLAILIGLAFWSFSLAFLQLGNYKYLPPTIAAWAPVVIFFSAGGYLLSRTRT